MATYSTYALRIPSSSMDDLRIASMRDSTSMDGLILQPVAEMMAGLRARGVLPDITAAEQAACMEVRAGRVQPGRFTEILAKAGTTEILAGDEIPEGWLGDPAANEAPASP